MNTQEIMKIEMACPYCEHQAKVNLASINKRVRCTWCSGKLILTPDIDTSKIIRLNGGCSVTKQTFSLAFQHDGEKHRFETVFYLHENESGPALVQTTSLKFEDVDFSKHKCPGCGNGSVDHCSICNTWICQGAVLRTSKGKQNTCPNCGPNIFDQPLIEVPIFRNAPGRSRMIEAAPIAIPNRPAIATSTELVRRSKW
jgi:ribosomal protein S27AE